MEKLEFIQRVDEHKQGIHAREISRLLRRGY